MIVICSCFCSPEGVINSSCGNYGFFLTWDNPFQTVGGAEGGGGALSKVESSARASPSQVYPAGKL